MSYIYSHKIHFIPQDLHVNQRKQKKEVFWNNLNSIYASCLQGDSNPDFSSLPFPQRDVEDAQRKKRHVVNKVIQVSHLPWDSLLLRSQLLQNKSQCQTPMLPPHLQK